MDGSKNIYSTGYFGGVIDFDPGVGVDVHNSQANSSDAFVIKLGPCINVTSSVLNISTCNSFSLNGYIYDSTEHISKPYPTVLHVIPSSP